MRKPLSKRILEWWNRVVIESLLDKRARGIYAWELKQFVAEMASQLVDDGITDDMSDVEVPNDLLPEGVMKTQLEVIDASVNQIKRSLRTEWRARHQRNIWIEDNPAILDRLTKYSAHLVEEWQNRWQDMRERVQIGNVEENYKKSEGRKLLDWSHYKAPKDVRPIKISWTNDDLVRGTYQILSKDLAVGWHPEFISLIKASDPEGK